jgi:hypothetical protein
MFYNTINLQSDELKQARLKAKSQQEFIKAVFNNHKDLKITPSQMLRVFGNDLLPITSVRRALTNLVYENFLEKTSEKVLGIYGKPEHIWKIKESKSITHNFF